MLNRFILSSRVDIWFLYNTPLLQLIRRTFDTLTTPVENMCINHRCFDGQMGEEGVNLWFSHLFGVADVMKKYEPFYPTTVSLFCSAAVMTGTRGFSKLIQKFRRSIAGQRKSRLSKLRLSGGSIGGFAFLLIMRSCFASQKVWHYGRSYIFTLIMAFSSERFFSITGKSIMQQLVFYLSLM